MQFVVDGSNFGSAVALNGSGQAASGSTSTLTVATHTVQANYSGSGSYQASNGTLSGGQVVNQASQTINFTINAPASAAYNSNFGVAATATSGLTVAFTASGSCSVVDNGDGTANYTMTSGTGPCSVIANQAGNSNYSAAPQVTETTNATPASQTITFTTNAPASAAYGAQFTVAATGGGSGNPVTFTSSGACSNTGATYTMTSGTGTCSVIANQAGNSNYSAAPQVTENTTATQAVLTVTANNTAITYGCGCSPVLTYGITGFQFSDNQGNSTTGSPAESTTGTQGGPVGMYTINISQGTLAAANYTFAFVNGTLTVGPATLTVTADNKTATEGDGLPTFTASYSGFVNGDNQGVLRRLAQLQHRRAEWPARGHLEHLRDPGNAGSDQLHLHLRERYVDRQPCGCADHRAAQEHHVQQRHGDVYLVARNQRSRLSVVAGQHAGRIRTSRP